MPPENMPAKTTIAPGVTMKTELLVVAMALILWGIAHIPGVMYGTHQIPLHQSYIGDEQSSVNGALHMLESRSIVGFRGHPVFYYGPLFAIIDTPAILADFALKYTSGVIQSADDYRNYIIYDWGGIVLNLHITAVLASMLGLYAAYCLMQTRTMNPAGRRWLPYFSVALLAVNFYFFEYSHFSKHWTFVIPLILLQIYSFVRISETEGKTHKYWLAHSAATIAVFGVSYVGILSLIVWLPRLIRVIRERDWMFLRTFTLYSLVILGGFLVMIGWNPYTFFRILSFLGIGEPGGGMGTAHNPFYFADNSIFWYGSQIVLNNLALVLALLLLSLYLFAKKIWRSPVLWSLLLPALTFFFFFALPSHHEGRYMLPTIVLLILTTGYLLSEYVAQTSSMGTSFLRPLLRTSLVTLFAFYFVFQIVVDMQWMHIYARGPIEKHAIAKILELQKSGGPVLVVQNYILGAPHDRVSYAAYIEKSGKADVNLYQAIAETEPPASVPLLNVRYAFLAEFAENPLLAAQYAHVIVYFRPVEGLINQFDYFDEDVMRLWHYDTLSPSYSLLE